MSTLDDATATDSSGAITSSDLTSDSDACSTPTSSCGATPRGDPAMRSIPGPPQGAVRPPPPVPRLGLGTVPRLDLGGTAAAAASAPAEPSARPAPLNLSLGGIGGGMGGFSRGANLSASPAQPFMQPQALQPQQNSSQPQFEVDLLSPAFAVTRSSSGPAEAVAELQQQCASKFGVRRDRVRVYGLVPVTGVDDLPAGCQRVAVQVHGSEFSLQAIEEVLAENQRLVAQSKIPSSDTSQLDALRRENAYLKQRLNSSELLRHRGQKALQELKEEFETLHFDLVSHTETVMTARGIPNARTLM